MKVKEKPEEESMKYEWKYVKKAWEKMTYSNERENQWKEKIQ